MRQLSNRNQRYSVKYRLRHFVQICLLLAICIWLVYQVKHSEENRSAFVDRDEVENRQELMNDDVKNEEGNGDADDWIDEQDHDQQGQEKEQEVEFKNEDKNITYMGKADLVDSFVREDSVLHAIEMKNERDDFSGSVALETHMNETEVGLADASEKPDDMDAHLEGSSFNVAVDVSNKIYALHNENLNDFMSNHSGIALRENTTFFEADNHSMNWTSTMKSELVFGVLTDENGSIQSPIAAIENNPNELQANSTAATIPLVTDVSQSTVSERLMETANHSTMADSLSYKKIQENETKDSIQNATLEENHSNLVELVVDLDNDLKSKTSGEQESEDEFATTSFSNTEVNLFHNVVTVEEREARTDLSTLPEIQNVRRHDYDETEE